MTKEYRIRFPMPDAVKSILTKDDYLYTLFEIMTANGAGIPNSREVDDIYIEIIYQFYKDIYKTDGGAMLMEALIDAYKTHQFKLVKCQPYKDFFTLHFE